MRLRRVAEIVAAVVGAVVLGLSLAALLLFVTGLVIVLVD